MVGVVTALLPCRMQVVAQAAGPQQNYDSSHISWPVGFTKHGPLLFLCRNINNNNSSCVNGANAPLAPSAGRLQRLTSPDHVILWRELSTEKAWFDFHVTG